MEEDFSRYVDIDNITVGGLPNAILVDKLVTDYKFSASFSSTSDADIDEVLEILAENYTLVHSNLSFEGDSFNSLYKTEFEHFSLHLHNKQWSGNMAGNDVASMEKIYNDILALLPPIEEKDPNRVYIKFWSFTGMAANAWLRQIDVQPWSDLAMNYPPEVAKVLADTLGIEPVVDGGKLILWHGKPGTGKTHAIRALAQNWKSWCSIEYVIDPERFFGDANYMVQTLMGSDHDRLGPPWRLIVIEDAGEFIRDDAAAKTGQGLSRLLNLTDGLIGQGLRILVLMTTNEKFHDLAESVQRTGRCLSHLEFRPFTQREATEWIGKAPVPAVGQTEWTLADLYALKMEQKQLLKEVTPEPAGMYL